MDKIKRFYECLIPVTACNLKCSYCYVMQRDNRKNKIANLKYSPEIIGKALTKERFGGVCYFSICGAGETTIQPQLEDIVYNILKNGHYVNITTNGTITKRIEEIVNKCKEFTNHLNFSFSFHYLELINKNLLNTFFDNIKMVREKGCSFVVQVNLCDEYEPYLDEINRICIEKIGAKPQLAATRAESKGLKKIKLLTSHTEDRYRELGKTFESPLFDFTMQNFNVKRKEFCYAGDWSGNLDLSTGILRRCYSSYLYQDIFKKPNEKIRFLAVGNKCNSLFCMNSSHFMALGVIPELKTPTYESLRNRNEANWYSKEMKDFLSKKLYENNNEYSLIKKMYSNAVGNIDRLVGKIYRNIKKQ